MKIKKPLSIAIISLILLYAGLSAIKTVVVWRKLNTFTVGPLRIIGQYQNEYEREYPAISADNEWLESIACRVTQMHTPPPEWNRSIENVIPITLFGINWFFMPDWVVTKSNKQNIAISVGGDWLRIDGSFVFCIKGNLAGTLTTLYPYKEPCDWSNVNERYSHILGTRLPNTYVPLLCIRMPRENNKYLYRTCLRIPVEDVEKVIPNLRGENSFKLHKDLGILERLGPFLDEPSLTTAECNIVNTKGRYFFVESPFFVTVCIELLQ